MCASRTSSSPASLPGSFTRGGSTPGDPGQVREQAVEREVPAREDVALTNLALLISEQVADGDVPDVDDVERPLDVGRIRRSRKRRTRSIEVPRGASGPSANEGFTITTGRPRATARRASSSASCLEFV